MEGYCCNPTRLEGFVRPRRSLGETVGAAEMYGFQTTNRIFRLVMVVRFKRDTENADRRDQERDLPSYVVRSRKILITKSRGMPRKFRIRNHRASFLLLCPRSQLVNTLTC